MKHAAMHLSLSCPSSQYCTNFGYLLGYKLLIGYGPACAAGKPNCCMVPGLSCVRDVRSCCGCCVALCAQELVSRPTALIDASFLLFTGLLVQACSPNVPEMRCHVLALGAGWELAVCWLPHLSRPSPHPTNRCSCCMCSR